MSRPWRQQNPRVTPDEQRFTEFSGVVNTRSRKDIGLAGLYDGTNVVISDSKKIVRRPGYSVLYSNDVRSAYSCGGRLYVVDGSTLFHMASISDMRTVVTGLTGTDYCWGDINGDVYYANGVDSGICRGDQWLPWQVTPPQITSVEVVDASARGATAFSMGATYTRATFRVRATYETVDGRESAPSDEVSIVGGPTTTVLRVTVPTGHARTHIYVTAADGNVFHHAGSTSAAVSTVSPTQTKRILDTIGTSGTPSGITHIAFMGGVCYAAQYLPTAGHTVVWYSLPFAFHLWNLSRDYLMLPGRLGLMVANNGGLLLGTMEAVYEFTDDGKLEQLTDYGVVPGVAGDVTGSGMAYFWTERGICRAMPFENLTEQYVSMASGERVASSMVYHNGTEQFIAVVQGGGTAFNSRTERM